MCILYCFWNEIKNEIKVKKRMGIRIRVREGGGVGFRFGVRVGVGLGWVMVMGNVGCTGLTIQGEKECVERWLDGWSRSHL